MTGTGYQRLPERHRDRDRARCEPRCGGSADQLLHAEPGGGAGQCPTRRHRRQHPVQLGADRTAQADERRVPRHGQLRVPVRAPDLVAAVAARGLVLRAQHGRHGSLGQGQLGLRAAVRPRQEMGLGRQRPGRRLHRRLGSRRRRPHPERPEVQLWRLPAGRDDRGGIRGHVQVLSRDRSDREGRERQPDGSGLHAADGRHPAVDHRDLPDDGHHGDGLHQQRPADRPVPRAGQRSRLRLRTTWAGRTA